MRGLGAGGLSGSSYSPHDAGGGDAAIPQAAPGHRKDAPKGVLSESVPWELFCTGGDSDLVSTELSVSSTIARSHVPKQRCLSLLV